MYEILESLKVCELIFTEHTFISNFVAQMNTSYKYVHFS